MITCYRGLIMATPKSHPLMKVHVTCLGEKKLFFWTNVGKPPNKDEMTGTSGNRWTLSLWTGGYEGRESWHWRMQTHPLPGREHGSGTSGCGSMGKYDTGRWSLFKIKVFPGKHLRIGEAGRVVRGTTVFARGAMVSIPATKNSVLGHRWAHL